MKTLKYSSAVILFFMIAVNLIYAQSDYEKVQNFKTKYKQIEESIKKRERSQSMF